MNPFVPVRRAAVLLLVGAGAGLAQTTLPATSPTAQPVVPSVSVGAPVERALRAGTQGKVRYLDGELEVTADNSSLNQILRDISRATGMVITGGVAEQRVFGIYGPAAAAKVIGDLLEGSGSNVLLRETSSAVPAELILTPRTGTVTPPNPNAALEAEHGMQGSSASSPGQEGAPGDGSAAARRAYVPPRPVAFHAQRPEPAATAVPGTAPATPSGPLTPEQVYQQLQQLQKAQPHP